MPMADKAPHRNDWIVDIAKGGVPIGNRLWGSQEELAKILAKNIVLAGSNPPKDTSIPRLIDRLNIVDGDQEHSFVILQQPFTGSASRSTSSTNHKIFWRSENPKHCNACKTTINDVFFEAHSRKHSYAILCPECFETDGFGLGFGKGRKFEKQQDQRFLKTAG